MIDVYIMIQTLSFLLNSGHRANSCIASVTVAKVCILDGNLDARHTDANTDAFNDRDLEALIKTRFKIHICELDLL